jgi:hypothetical protein
MLQLANLRLNFYNIITIEKGDFFEAASKEIEKRVLGETIADLLELSVPAV